MAGNSFGELFRVTTFGESHGTAIGVVIDGCPAGLELDLQFVQSELDRRKPGQSHITTQRKETDEFEILSGMFEGKTLGTPLTFIIRNQDYKPPGRRALSHLLAREAQGAPHIYGRTGVGGRPGSGPR